MSSHITEHTPTNISLITGRVGEIIIHLQANQDIENGNKIQNFNFILDSL